MTLGELFAGIANAIRSKDGTTDRIPALTFPERILAISGGGGGGGPFAKVSVFEGPDGEIVDIPVNISAEVSAIGSDYPVKVVPVDGADYGFSLNSAGYYESENKGVNSSYAMCKIVCNWDYEFRITLKCINYAEANYDFGLISEVDTMLSMDNSADSTGVLKNFKGSSSASVVYVSVTFPAGQHFVCVKFRKDGGGNSNNDSLQFMV